MNSEIKLKETMPRISQNKAKYGIKKRLLEFDERTFARENFIIHLKYKERQNEIETDCKAKRQISKKDLIGTIPDLAYDFERLERMRFKKNAEQIEIEKAKIEKKSEGTQEDHQSSEDVKENKTEIEIIHNLKGFDVASFNKKRYIGIFKEKYHQKSESNHAFLDKLRKIEDFGGSMVNPPKTDVYLMENSTLRGKFMVSQPLYNEITPCLDFGDEILSIFREKKFSSKVEDYEFYGKYTTDMMKADSDVLLDPLEYCLQISGLVDEREKLQKKVEKEEEELDQDLIDYLSLWYDVPPPKKDKEVEQKRGSIHDSSVVKFLSSKVRYYERPEKHQLKRNFQVQVERTEKCDRTLTLNDFENKIKHLGQQKKKMVELGDRVQKTDIENYKHEIEDVLDIVLNLQPELLRSGVYQSLEQKIKLLTENIAKFKQIYLGKLYCPEIISFILKEYLQLTHKVNISTKKDNFKPIQVYQGGKPTIKPTP
jgi:hypothetical protein